MTQQRLRRAIYEFPVPIWIGTGALGQTLTTSFRGVPFEVHMPRLGGDNGQPPDIEGMADRDLMWTHKFAGWLPEGRENSLAVCRVGITTPQDPDNDHPYDRLDAVIDDWFDCVRTWVEVVTGQDLDPQHRVYDVQEVGRGLVYLDADDSTSHGMWITTPMVNPLLAQDWPIILERVAAGEIPFLEHLFCRDARAAHARGYYRRAVVDAATATEVLLVRVLQRVAGTLSNKDQKKLSDRPTFGMCIGIAKRADLDLPVTFERLDHLNDARIAAVHHGESADSFEAVRCVQTCIDFVLGHDAVRAE